MLDLTAISVVDNHCHPILLEQHMSGPQFRQRWTEAKDGSLAEKHLHNSVYYLWTIRQLAQFYGCENTEDAVLAARDSQSGDELLARLVKAANIDALVLDLGYPPPEISYTAEYTAQAAGCRTVSILRVEILMQQLILQYENFDEVIERLAQHIKRAREDGYRGLKSIAAYRTGLNIAEWSKDEAAAVFAKLRPQAVSEGSLRLAHKPLNDYLLHVVFQAAAEQQLPIQFHTGYGDSDTDMRLGNPLQLRDVLERSDYQSMPVVLLHESYPYSQLGAYLAAIYPHVYFDLSYTIPFIDKLEMLAFTRQALSIAPASKLVYSTDGIYMPEMYWLGAVRGRSVLAQVLQEMIEADELDEQQAYHLARLVLHDTAAELYALLP
ncbi:amidohydrolase family protein [Ktedonosporobacter rubrisoli]|nr:amidohydrolase family protein [Ktedonosporobacter rubrisoli]